jgi:hypothetical protein
MVLYNHGTTVINVKDFTDLGKFFDLTLLLDVAIFTRDNSPQDSNAGNG